MENLYPGDIQDKDIEQGEILDYYDGPQLVLVRNRFLALRINEDDWLVIDPSEKDLEIFFRGEICLRSLILLESTKNWTKDKQIKEEYLPELGYFYVERK